MSRLARGLVVVVVVVVVMMAAIGVFGLLGACSRAGEAPQDLQDGKDIKDSNGGPEVKGEGVLVSAADRARLGIATAELQATERQGRSEGFATVISVEALGEIDADLAAARVAAVASRAALARAEALYADQVSVSLAAVETARQQAAADDAQVQRLERRLALEWGPSAAGSPFSAEASRRAWLDRLAVGRAALARVQFPLGTVLPERTPTLHLESLAATVKTTSSPTDRLAIERVWPAPEDPALPGPAFFALISGRALPQIGERLRAGADTSHLQHGVTIPESAIVLSGGSAWCFIEQPGEGGSSRFVRRPVVGVDEGGNSTSASLAGSTPGGTFAAAGFTAGEKVVVQGAGLLLAHEVSSAAGSAGGVGANADDEDD